MSKGLRCEPEGFQPFSSKRWNPVVLVCQIVTIDEDQAGEGRSLISCLQAGARGAATGTN
jgi:hypothetical protein